MKCESEVLWSTNMIYLFIYLNCNPTDANQQEVISNQQGVKFQ